MSEVGCYSLHLYCDDPKHDRIRFNNSYWPGEYTGRDLAQARKEAKAEGWKFLRERSDKNSLGSGPKTICPRCVENKPGDKLQ